MAVFCLPSSLMLTLLTSYSVELPVCCTVNSPGCGSLMPPAGGQKSCHSTWTTIKITSFQRSIAYTTNHIRVFAVTESAKEGTRSSLMKIRGRGVPATSCDTSTMDPITLQHYNFSSKSFPIHVKSQTEDWKYLGLTTESRYSLQNFVIVKTTAFLNGMNNYHPSVDSDAWLNHQQLVIAAAAEEAYRTTFKFTSLRIQFQVIRDFGFMEIRLPSDSDGVDLDDNFAINNLAQRHMIEGPPGSILSAANSLNFQSRVGTSTMFSRAVADFDRHSECASTRSRQFQRTDRL